jgi:hypothetical protein
MKDYNNITGLKNEVSNCIRWAYDKGYKDGSGDKEKLEKEYKHGLENMLEYIKLIWNDMGEKLRDKYFDGRHCWSDIIKAFTAEEIQERVRAYKKDLRDNEKAQKEDIWRVGDEVIEIDDENQNPVTAVLLSIDPSDNLLWNAMDAKGELWYVNFECWKKTGKHYDVALPYLIKEN